MAEQLNGKETMEKRKSRSSITDWCIQNHQAIIAEFIASNLILFFGCMSCIPLPGLSSEFQPPVWPTLGFGLTVLILVQAFGHISGAHFNPAVTLAAVISGVTSPLLGVCYLIAQIAGAITGYGILVAVTHIDIVGTGVCVTAPQEGLTAVQSLGIEIILTSALAFTACSVWDPRNKSNSDSTPIKFGLAVAGICIVGAPLTGAGINPVRSLAPAIYTGQWTLHWIYWAGPLIGAGVAAVIYKYLLLVPSSPKSREEQPLA